MRVKRVFAQETRARQAERAHKLSLSHAQRYVLRELQLIYMEASDEDLKAQINLLESAFRGAITDALNRELNPLRRNGVTGAPLLRNLSQLYRQHNMREWNTRQQVSTVPERRPTEDYLQRGAGLKHRFCGGT